MILKSFEHLYSKKKAIIKIPDKVRGSIIPTIHMGTISKYHTYYQFLIKSFNNRIKKK